MFSTIRLQVFVCLALGLAVQAAPAGTAGAEVAARSPHNYEYVGDYNDHSDDIFGEGGIFGTGNDDDVDFLNADLKRGLSLGSMSNVDGAVDLSDLAHVGVGADSSASAASDTADLASILASVNAGASADVDRRLIIEDTLGAGEDLLNSFGFSGNADTSSDTSSSDSSTGTSFSGGASGMGGLGGLSGVDFGSSLGFGANLGRRQDDPSVTASSTSVAAEASATADVNVNAPDINSILQQLQNDQDFSVDGNGVVHGGQLNGFDLSTVVGV